MPVGQDFIYPDPRTPGHVRDVLRTIQEKTSSTSAEVAAIAADLDTLEGLVGPFSLLLADTAVGGQPVYVNGSGEAALADAGALATSDVVGLVLAGASAGSSATILPIGTITISDWTAITGTAALTPGARYCLSTTAGMLTTTPPSAAGEVVVVVGVALTAAKMKITLELRVLKA